MVFGKKIREDCFQLNLEYAHRKKGGNNGDNNQGDFPMRHGPLRDLVPKSRHLKLPSSASVGIYYCCQVSAHFRFGNMTEKALCKTNDCALHRRCLEATFCLSISDKTWGSKNDQHPKLVFHAFTFKKIAQRFHCNSVQRRAILFSDPSIGVARILTWQILLVNINRG